jgi:tetratricopeptide (TPR) repeat protein
MLGASFYVFFYRRTNTVKGTDHTDHGQCLTDETVTEYLEGGLDPVMKAASEAHLVACSKCRSNLAFFMRVLNSEVAPEEANTLQAITAKWTGKKRDRQLPQRVVTPPKFLFRWVAVAAVLVMGVLSVRFVIQGPAEPKSAGEVVQLLLAQDRPFESRMAGEKHLPIVRTRGAEDAGVSYGLLAGEMTRLSANNYEMGRFYLLQKDFDRAIPYLEMAAPEVGAGAAVHNDLGVAYLESGNAAAADKAGQEFQHALQRDPSFAEAAFNLAVFYERMNENALAATQWKRYLELDSKSDWAKEARGRLQELSR